MDWNEIGKRIRAQREAYGYSREVFAEKIDVTAKFCSDIELGIKGMSIPTLCRIADVLNLSVDYILFGDKKGEGDSHMITMINKCPEKQRQHLEAIIKIFLNAVEK